MHRKRGRPKEKVRRSRMEKLKALLKGAKDSEPKDRGNVEGVGGVGGVEETNTEISNTGI